MRGIHKKALALFASGPFGPAEGDYVRASLGLAKCRPCLHELAPLLKQVAAPVGLLDLVTDDVCTAANKTTQKQKDRLRDGLSEVRG